MTYNYWDTDYNTTVNYTEAKATGLTTAQCRSNDAGATIRGLQTSPIAYWYFPTYPAQNDNTYYPQLTAFAGAVTVPYATITRSARRLTSTLMGG